MEDLKNDRVFNALLTHYMNSSASHPAIQMVRYEALVEYLNSKINQPKEK